MKIPKQAKKVFQGEVFSIHQWSQKMFDGTTRTFEMAKKSDGVAIIATVGNKIVVIKQQQPLTGWYLSLPGGYADVAGETPKQAALRELKEETGLKPKSIKLWKTLPFGHRVEGNLYFFIAKNCEKITEPRPDGGERIKANLYTFEQFLDFSIDPTFHNTRMVVELLKAKLIPKEKAKLKEAIFGK